MACNLTVIHLFYKLLGFETIMELAMIFGKVCSLWRYPVKSLIGEQLARFDIDMRGISGDRILAISNAEGKFGSGKNTRRFRRMDGLFSMSARTTENGVSIAFPDGSELTDKNPTINDKLSKILKQNVTLTREAEIPHFDDGAIHLLTTGSLTLLENILPDSGINPRRFRPNIVIDSHLLDEGMIGQTLTIGDVILEITHKTERCRMITVEQQCLESRPEILKSVAANFNLDFGVYARVLSPGTISMGNKAEFNAVKTRSLR
jgi:uncharacterized protein YcbX